MRNNLPRRQNGCICCRQTILSHIAFAVSRQIHTFVRMIIQMQKAKPRIEELDFLKCVFITLMIAFHLVYIGNTYPVAKQLVYTFHMPGFLLVSGYLFNVDKPWTAFGKTLLWIFIPYAMMETGYTVMASMLPIREHIDHLTPGLIVDHVFLHPMGPYWYLHTLMLCGACYYFAFRKPRRRFAQSVRKLSLIHI